MWVLPTFKTANFAAHYIDVNAAAVIGPSPRHPAVWVVIAPRGGADPSI